MPAQKIEAIGNACGRHGPYTFYKACRCQKHGFNRTLALGEFFFLRISDNLPLAIGELQLLWRNRSEPEQLLCSLRLYFLPEDTPDGRLTKHGEHELLATNEKVVIKAEALLSWVTIYPEWCVGSLPPSPHSGVVNMTSEDIYKTLTLVLPKFQNCDILLNELIATVTAYAVNSPAPAPHCGEAADYCSDADVHIISFNRYCRLQTIVLRLRTYGVPQWLLHAVFCAVSGLDPAATKNTRVLFCRHVFESSQVDAIVERCDYLAPNLKGRPRKRSRLFDTQLENRKKARQAIRDKVNSGNRRVKTPPNEEKENDESDLLKACGKVSLDEEERRFLMELHKYMKTLHTPIVRIPSLGTKPIDLWKFYRFVRDHGGYQKICDRRLWKKAYEHLKCPKSSTSAATQTRRHYEKLLLPYEIHVNSQTGLKDRLTAQSAAAQSPPKLLVTLAGQANKKKGKANEGQSLMGPNKPWGVVKKRRKGGRKKSPDAVPDETNGVAETKTETTENETIGTEIIISEAVDVIAKPQAIDSEVVQSDVMDAKVAETAEIESNDGVSDRDDVELELRCTEEFNAEQISRPSASTSVSLNSCVTSCLCSTGERTEIESPIRQHSRPSSSQQSCNIPVDGACGVVRESNVFAEQSAFGARSPLDANRSAQVRCLRAIPISEEHAPLPVAASAYETAIIDLAPEIQALSPSFVERVPYFAYNINTISGAVVAESASTEREKLSPVLTIHRPTVIQLASQRANDIRSPLIGNYEPVSPPVIPGADSFLKGYRKYSSTPDYSSPGAFSFESACSDSYVVSLDNTDNDQPLDLSMKSKTCPVDAVYVDGFHGTNDSEVLDLSVKKATSSFYQSSRLQTNRIDSRSMNIHGRFAVTDSTDQCKASYRRSPTNGIRSGLESSRFSAIDREYAWGTAGDYMACRAERLATTMPPWHAQNTPNSRTAMTVNSRDSSVYWPQIAQTPFPVPYSRSERRRHEDVDDDGALMMSRQTIQRDVTGRHDSLLAVSRIALYEDDRQRRIANDMATTRLRRESHNSDDSEFASSRVGVNAQPPFVPDVVSAPPTVAPANYLHYAYYPHFKARAETTNVQRQAYPGLFMSFPPAGSIAAPRLSAPPGLYRK